MRVSAKVVVDDNHQIVVQLPEDVPPGELEVVVNFESGSLKHDADAPLTRDEVRRRFAAAGLLMQFDAPAEAFDLKEAEQEEIDRVTALRANGRTTLDDINEDREERF